jgi:ABC-type branched-subunit amino acid transport system ATPase component
MTNNSNPKYVLETHDLEIFYGSFKAVTDVNVKVEQNKVTAIIGPSGMWQVHSIAGLQPHERIVCRHIHPRANHL